MPAKTRKLTKVTTATPVIASPVPVKRPIDFYLWGTVVAIICVSFIRLRLLSIPLERDEGEYAYMGKLILNGMAPYKEAYNMKLPGTYFMYAMIMGIFGKTITGIHLGFLFLNAATMFIFFLGFRKLYNSSIGFFTSASYGIMALSGSVLGFAAHATHFVSFFVALGIFFLSKFYSKEAVRFSFFAGLMFGFSFLMKQQAVFFLVFGGLAVVLPYLIKKPIALVSTIKQGMVFTVGALLPYIIVMLLFKWAGAFDKFWFWTVTYASKYASGLSFQQGQLAFKSSFVPMWKEFGFLWLLFFTGFVFVLVSRFPLKQKLFALGFAFFAFLTICPGFYFRQHYFVSLFPAVGLLSAISLSVILSFAAKITKLKSLAFLLPVVLALCFITTLAQKSDYYLKSEPDEISKLFYGNNPFVESVEIGDFIQQNSSPSDKIAVIGSEPQIYLYGERFAGTGYLYTYGLVETHAYNKQMQEEMIAEIEKAKPEFIVYCNVEFSWLYHPGAPRLIYDWADNYSNQYYELVGIIDMANPLGSIYKWNEEAKTYKPTGKEFLKVYKRK